MRSSSCLVLVAVVGGAIIAHATSSTESEVRDLYRRGLQGDKAAVEQCITKLEQTLKTEPQNQLARVYLGSAYTLRSRDLGFGPKKLQVLRQGVAVMDEAVAAVPSDAKVRLARALTTSALPAILGYRAASRKDFELLAAAAEHNPASFEESDLQIVFYNAGLAAKENGNRARAVALWQQGLRHPADPALTEKLNAALR